MTPHLFSPPSNFKTHSTTHFSISKPILQPTFQFQNSFYNPVFLPNLLPPSYFFFDFSHSSSNKKANTQTVKVVTYFTNYYLPSQTKHMKSNSKSSNY